MTGKYNYQKFAEEMNDPKILSEGYAYVAANYPADAAAFWWHTNNMNRLVDNIQDRDAARQVVLVSARVNGFDPDDAIPERANINDRIRYYDELQDYDF